jgi:PAS domain S-box-containing protein
MNDVHKTKMQLVDELMSLRAALGGESRRVADLEQALDVARKSEQRLRLLFNQAPIAYQALDENGYLIEVNKAWLDMLGYAKEYVIGRWFGEFLAPNLKDDFSACYERLKATGEVRGVEWEVVHRDGMHLIASFDSVISYDAQGNFQQIHCTMRDVTERKRMEEALRETEMRYRTVADFTYDWEYWMAPDGRLLYVSPSCERITGYRVEQFINSPQLLGQIVLSQDRDIWDQHHQDHSVVTGPRTIQFRVRRQDGEIRWIEHACQPVVTEQDGFLGSRISNRDITERKRAEDALRQSKNRYRRLFSEMVAGSALQEIICDEAGHPVDYVTLEVNKAYEVMLDVKREDVIGKKAGALLPKDELENWLEVFGPVALTGKPVRYTMYSPSNQKHFDGTVYSPAPNQFAVTFNDITERKRIEETLRKSEELFRSIVEQLADGVAVANEQGRITVWNRSMERLTGLPDREMLGKLIWDAQWQMEPEEERTAERYQQLKVALRALLRTGEAPWAGKMMLREYVQSDGTRLFIEGTVFAIKTNTGFMLGSIAHDTTERARAEEAIRLNEARLDGLLKLSQMTEASLKQLANFALEKAIQLTQSEIGFLGFMDQEETVMQLHAWSKNAMAQCSVADYPLHFPVDEAGIWGEVIRQRKSLVANNYSAPDLPRKGYPEGHVPLSRLLTIPVFEGQRIVAVAAVANKTTPYNDSDMRQLTLLMDGMWRIVRQRQAEEMLRANEEMMRTLFDILPVGISVLNREFEIIEMNPELRKILDMSTEELQEGQYRQRKYLRGDGTPMPADEFASTRAIREQRPIHNVETGVVKMDGAVVWTAVSAALLPDGNAVLAVLDITERKRMEEVLLQHNRQLTLLNHVRRVLNASLDPAQVLTTLLAETQRAMDVTACSVWLLDMDSDELVCQYATGPQNKVVHGWRLAPGQGFAGWVLRQGKSLIVPDVQADERHFDGVDQQTGLALRSILTVPLQTSSGVIGVIQAVDTEVDAFDATSLQLLEALAAIAAAAISNARLFEEVQDGRARLQTLSQRLVEAQETERRRVARELHDVIGQALTAVKINLQAAQRLLDVPEPEERLRQSLEQVVNNVENTLQQVRDLSVNLRPSLLDDLGLVPAVRWYLDRQAQQVGFSAQFFADPTLERRLPPHLEVACFRIVQEALTNVARHAHAQSVRVEMREQNQELVLCIVDDGVGFDVQKALQDSARGVSLGLLGMQERVNLVGGKVEFVSALNKGTTITIRLPLTLAQATEVWPQ